MLRQFILGGAVCVCNITIHALFMTVLVRVAQNVGAIGTKSPSLLLAAIMIATISVLMVAHTLEVVVWSMAYAMVDAVPPGSSNMYLAYVSYATLGYGDVVPVKDWQLLGPITAMNGILLFGWSTAVIFEILEKAMALTSSTTTS